MWLMTPTGFFSVVGKPADKAGNTLTVRARTLRFGIAQGNAFTGTRDDYGERQQRRSFPCSRAACRDSSGDGPND